MNGIAIARNAPREPQPEARGRSCANEPAITVVICAHNSTGRLPPTLFALREQVEFGRDWEVVVVDNASSDDTPGCCESLWDHPMVPLRVLREERPGLSFARQAGVAGARGKYVCFVDDDNRLCPTYLRDAFEIMEAHADVAVVGGVGEAVTEGERPPWIWRGWQSHAVGPQGEREGYVGPARGFVYGAGAVVRHAALEELVAAGYRGLLAGRTGLSLGSGDDVELCFAIRLLGWKVYYSPRLRFGHWMPEGRLTLEYCLRLFSAFGQANAVLELYEPWLSGGARSVLKRSLPGVIVHELLELKRLRKQDKAVQPEGEPGLLLRMEARGKRDAIRELLRTGKIVGIHRELTRFAKAANRVRSGVGGAFRSP